MSEAPSFGEIQFLTNQIVAPLMNTPRHNLVPGELRHESVAEHSFHVACIVHHLSSKYPDLDYRRCVGIALEHDFAESITGDVSVYASEEELRTKPLDEEKAIIKLRNAAAEFGLTLCGLEDYVTHSTREAGFVCAVDKIVPYYLVLAGEGHHANPTPDEFDLTSSRARTHVANCFAELLPVFEQVSTLVRARVVRLHESK